MLLTQAKKILGRAARYDCGYADWQTASRQARGYGDDEILSRVVGATRKVVAGEAAYERDSVVFARPECPFHLLVPLLIAAGDSRGITVLDYGGSLGSTYRQCRPYLESVGVSWNIVEQQEFVAAGRREFETEELRFFEHIDELRKRPDVVLFSSSLQYLPKPHDVLRSVTATGCRHMVIDRTPIGLENEDHACVQHVPRHIYPGSYPFWILSRDRLVETLSESWRVFADYSAPEGSAVTQGGMSFEFRGLILRRKYVE